MKGTPEAPRCGFSMRVVGVLEQLGVEYGAIDVLPGARAAARGDRRDLRLADLPAALRQRRAGRRRRHRRGDARVRRAGRAARRRAARAAADRSAKQELQADPQQSPPMQIERSARRARSTAQTAAACSAVSSLHLEGGAAAAGGDDVRVVDREAGALEAVDVVDLGAEDELHAHLVDDDRRRPGARRRGRRPWAGRRRARTGSRSSRRRERRRGAPARRRSRWPPSSSLILPAALSVSVDGLASAVTHRYLNCSRSSPARAPQRFRPARPLRVAPIEVLEDPLRVVDHLVAVDQHRHAPLPGQLHDLGALRAPVAGPARCGTRARASPAAARPRRRGRGVGAGCGSGRGRSGDALAPSAEGKQAQGAAGRRAAPGRSAGGPRRGRRARRAASGRRPRASPRGAAARSRALAGLVVAVGPPLRAGADLVGGDRAVGSPASSITSTASEPSARPAAAPAAAARPRSGEVGEEPLLSVKLRPARM